MSQIRRSSRIINTYKTIGNLKIPPTLEEKINATFHKAPTHLKIRKSINNSDPRHIDQYGFVESSDVLPKDLLDEIIDDAINRIQDYDARHDGIEFISNALQVDVSEEHLDRINKSVASKTIVKDAMKIMFGEKEDDTNQSSPSYVSYSAATPKVLISLPGSAPQLPHADDHCSSCIVCLLHLADSQEPTRIAAYSKKEKDYPTGITVTCVNCKHNEMLPDHDYRRGLHLAKSWSCSDCEKPKQPFDSERNLHDKIITAFSELLERSAPDLCDSYCGKEDTKMGDGYLALPTLIHCGPGRALSCAEPRYMLFFTLRPKYTGIKRGRQTQQHQYNPNDQYHAGALLAHKRELMRLDFKKQKEDVKEIYKDAYVDIDKRLDSLIGFTEPPPTKKVKPREYSEKARHQRCAWVVCGKAIECGGFTKEACKVYGKLGTKEPPSKDEIERARKANDATRKKIARGEKKNEQQKAC